MRNNRINHELQFSTIRAMTFKVATMYIQKLGIIMHSPLVIIMHRTLLNMFIISLVNITCTPHTKPVRRGLFPLICTLSQFVVIGRVTPCHYHTLTTIFTLYKVRQMGHCMGGNFNIHIWAWSASPSVQVGR